jgi:hypothetical protein
MIGARMFDLYTEEILADRHTRLTEIHVQLTVGLTDTSKRSCKDVVNKYDIYCEQAYNCRYKQNL